MSASRFIASGSPFTKPTSFEFPRHGLPPSPPETLPGIPHILSAPGFGAHDFFSKDPLSATGAPDHYNQHSARSTKTSSIPYHSSPVAREMHRPTLSRPKALVLIIPPATLLEEPGASGAK